MKDIFVFAILLVLWSARAEETKNLHPNPGTEMGTTGFGSYLGAGKVYFSTTDEISRNGNRSVFIQCIKDKTTAALMLCGSTGYLPRKALSVEAGQIYDVNFFIKSTKKTDNLTYYVLFWKKNMHDAKGRVYRSATLYIDDKRVKKLQADNKWEKVTMHVVVPSGVDKMDIAIQIIKGFAGDNVFIDDVKIIRVSP